MSNEFYRSAGVPERHKPFRPDQSDTESWNNAYNGLKERLRDGILTAVVGNRGTGKTQLGVCLVGHCAFNLEKTCLYCKSTDIFLRIRESMRTEGDSEVHAISEFIKPFFLVVDAYEVRAETQFENRILDHIIDKRYDSLKSTMIISNDSIETIKKQLGESICDRMRETGGIIQLSYNSFRNGTTIAKINL